MRACVRLQLCVSASLASIWMRRTRLCGARRWMATGRDLFSPEVYEDAEGVISCDEVHLVLMMSATGRRPPLEVRRLLEHGVWG